MSDAESNGVFRSKVFGGFDKKEVFSYFDELKRNFNAERDELLKQIETLKSESEGRNSESGKKDKQINDLVDALKKLKSDYESVCEENKSFESENERLKQLSSSASEKNDAAVETNKRLENDFHKLRDVSSRLKDSAVQAREMNEKLQTANTLLQQKSERLTEQLENMTQKLGQYEHNNQHFVSEIGRLKSVSQELSRRLNSSEDNLKYKERYDELSRKVLSTQSEITALKDILDEEKQRRDQLEAAVNELSTIDFSVFDSATSQISDLVGASQNIKETVYSALEKCTPQVALPQTKQEQQDFEATVDITPTDTDYSLSESDELIRKMNEEIEQFSSVISAGSDADIQSDVITDDNFMADDYTDFTTDDIEVAEVEDENTVEPEPDVQLDSDSPADSTPLNFGNTDTDIDGSDETDTEENDE